MISQVLLQEPPPDSQGGDPRTIPLCFWQDEKRSHHFEVCPEHAILLNKSLPSSETFFLPGPNRPREKKNTQFQPLSCAFLSYFRWGGLKSTLSRSQSRSTGSAKRLTPDHRTVECFPSHRPYHIVRASA